jgi:predicted MFS family arabinose efflux permease
VNRELFEGKRMWNVVYALSVSQMGIIIAEMLPTSLLTPMASDLGVSEGLAGQAVSVTAVSAMISSLFAASAMKRFDRRPVFLGFAALLICSNALAALATNYIMLLVSRALLGLSLGGFCSLVPASATRLVDPVDVPRALAIILSGISIAMVVAAPFGSFFGGLVGWRGVFLLALLLSVASFAWQFAVMPPMDTGRNITVSTIFRLFGRRNVAFAMLATILYFGGHWTFYTYSRPFLEQIAGFEIRGVSASLLCFGLATILGTLTANFLTRRGLWQTLAFVPMLLAMCSCGMIAFAGSMVVCIVLFILWGFAFGVMPVAWATWLTRAIPDEIEVAGGLQISSIQLAITVGAGVGGGLFEIGGSLLTLAGAGAAMLGSAVLVLLSLRLSDRQTLPA